MSTTHFVGLLGLILVKLSELISLDWIVEIIAKLLVLGEIRPDRI